MAWNVAQQRGSWRHRCERKPADDPRPCRSTDTAGRPGHDGVRLGVCRSRPHRDDDRARQLYRFAGRHSGRARLRARNQNPGFRRIDTVRLCRAVSRRRQAKTPVSRGDRSTAYLFCHRGFASNGRTLLAPRLAPLGEAVRAASDAPARIVGSAAQAVADGLADAGAAPVARRQPRGARYRLGRPNRRRSARRAGRRQGHNICARPMRNRNMAASAGAPMMNFVSRLLARRGGRFLRSAAGRRCRNRCHTCRVVSARLGRTRLPAVDREQCGSCHRVTSGRKLIPALSCRGAPPAKPKSFRSRLRRHGADARWRGRCSTCTCGAWPGSARARYSWKSANTMRPPPGFIGAPVSAKWVDAKVITKAAQRRWCCAATFEHDRKSLPRTRSGVGSVFERNRTRT